MWIIGRERGGYIHRVGQGRGEECGSSGGRFRRKRCGRVGHGLVKRPAKRAETWKESNPEQETMENLFEGRDGLYKGAK